jgi:hypothetical protein
LLPTIIVYLVALVPAIWWFWLAAADRLGAEPMRELEHALGLWALRFLTEKSEDESCDQCLPLSHVMQASRFRKEPDL